MTDRSEDAATYVFCVVQSKQAPVLRDVPASLPGAGPVRVMPIERDLWVAVADAPRNRFSAEQIQRDLQDIDRVSRQALAHASVVEFFFRRSAVVPLKLFTLFATDERAVAHLRRRRTTLRRVLARVRGFQEWGAWITITGAAPAGTSVRRPSSGRQYLEIKKGLRDQAPSRAAATRAAARAVASLGALAAAVRREKLPPPGAERPLVVSASFLVRASRRHAWQARAKQLAATLARDGNRLELSGPWPPYHFVTGR